MALITSANAREMSAKAHAARAAIRQAEKTRLAMIDDLLAKAALAPATPPDLPEQEIYLSRRLTRVRAQIDLLSDMLEQEKDAAKLDRLVSALYRLQELERTMAGRPLPGSRRPPREDPPSAKPAPRALPVPQAPRPPAPPINPPPVDSSPILEPQPERRPFLSEPPEF